MGFSLLDSENATEIARRFFQECLSMKMMGGLFPEQADLAPFHRILDLGCGPGGWSISVAHTYPKCHVVGMDCPAMIEYAQSLLGLHRIQNVQFAVMSAEHPLPIDGQSVDLVNLRLGGCSFPPLCWPYLMAECVRVVHPGGMIRVIEADYLGVTNSEAHAVLTKLHRNMLQQPGEEQDLRGTTASVEWFLRDAGCRLLHQQTYIIDVSFGMEIHESYAQHCSLFLTGLLLHRIHKVVSQDEVHHLLLQMSDDMQSKTFQGQCNSRIWWSTLQSAE